MVLLGPLIIVLIIVCYWLISINSSILCFWSPQRNNCEYICVYICMHLSCFRSFPCLCKFFWVLSVFSSLFTCEAWNQTVHLVSWKACWNLPPAHQVVILIKILLAFLRLALKCYLITPVGSNIFGLDLFHSWFHLLGLSHLSAAPTQTPLPFLSSPFPLCYVSSDLAFLYFRIILPARPKGLSLFQRMSHLLLIEMRISCCVLLPFLVPSTHMQRCFF